MSALAPTFGEAAPPLEAGEFRPIPITLPRAGDANTGKKPPASLPQWQIPRLVAEALLHGSAVRTH
jgi:hypothetical protein